MIHEFKSSTLSSGNMVFPARLTIDTGANSITIFKRRLIGYDRTTLRTDRIISVEIKTFNDRIFFSEINIVTYGGSVICINGFTHGEVKTIKSIIESMI